MADFVRGLFGGSQPAQAPVSGDDDFADYAGAPEPEPASLSAFTTATAPSSAPTASLGQRPYTAWYRVWERTTLDDFKMELYILPFVFVVIIVHVWGTRTNRRKASAWAKAHAPILHQEFAQVGYIRPQASVDDVGAVGLAQATEKAKKDAANPDNILREKKADEFASYATGRQNVAFIDFKLNLAKRYNPLMLVGESLMGLFFESLPAPVERLEATSYVFDGREAQIAPFFGKGEDSKRVPNSAIDGFVFAIVHKDLMKRLREDRYDLSLTATKDHHKLPVWTTVMSENAEITEALLTPELTKAINEAGDRFEALVISDQPMDQPKKLDDTAPRKRVNLSLKLASDYKSTLPLFQYFVRLPDVLVSVAHFRPEAMRRIKQTRQEQIDRIKRLDEDEKAEERKLQNDKLKKEKRDQVLGRMSADEQRKYLDKERERESKRGQKKRTMKG